jgi:septum formation protein
MAQSNTLILASASPRRRELLGMLGVDFLVRPSNVNEEPVAEETPLETQHRITRDKARSATANLMSQVETPTVIACDTTVLLDGEMLNKPANAAEARDMLHRLRGREHEVQSTIVVLDAEGERASEITSRVVMRSYSDDEIEAYVATGDPFDKAGSYAVQHELFKPVQKIQGCPLNVIGLALCGLRKQVPTLPSCAHVCAQVIDEIGLHVVNRPCEHGL